MRNSDSSKGDATYLLASPGQRWNLARTLLVLVVALVLAACGTRDPQPLRLREPVWQSGETSIYRVTNREGEVVGNAHHEIRASGEHVADDGWTFYRQIEDVGISEVVTVEVQASGYLPIYSQMTRLTAEGQQVVEATHNRAQIDIALTNQRGATVYERVNVPSDVRDERTILALLRTLPFERGYTAFINSFLPVTGTTDRLSLRLIDEQTITVPLGTFDTWAFQVQGNGQTTQVWIAKEAPHPIIKYVDGRSQGTFELIEFEPDGQAQE